MQADKDRSKWTDEGVQAGKFEDLYAVVARIRDEDPWDHEQTLESLRTNLLDELAELLAGIEIYERSGNADNLCEELGDLLLVMLLMVRIADEEGLFELEDVIRGISRKMIRRHPYVFGEDEAKRCMPDNSALPDDPADFESDPEHLQRWMAIKRAEKQVQDPDVEEMKREAKENALKWLQDQLDSGN